MSVRYKCKPFALVLKIYGMNSHNNIGVADLLTDKIINDEGSSKVLKFEIMLFIETVVGNYVYE